MHSQKIVLVTGASSGIGRHAALALAARGHRVFAAARRLSALESLAKEARSGAIVPLALDVDDAASISAAVAEVFRATDGHGVDVLVNNAGFATAGALAELSDANLRAQFETNVFGLMALTRALLPKMFERRAGRIINVSSVSGRVPAPMLGAYHATKYALEALSDALRMELHPFGIDVVVVEPGTIKTEFAQRATTEATRARASETRYRAIYDELDTFASRFDKLAASPEHVVRAIDRAVHARRPKSRYVAPARFLALIAAVALMPTCVTDAITRRLFGLTPRRLES
jgi:short-subunit dehydrogenase